MMPDLTNGPRKAKKNGFARVRLGERDVAVLERLKALTGKNTSDLIRRGLEREFLALEGQGK